MVGRQSITSNLSNHSFIINQEYFYTSQGANSHVKAPLPSPVLFNVMVNDMFEEVGVGFCRSLFADDGAISKRGCNVGYLMKQMQGGLDKVQA